MPGFPNQTVAFKVTAMAWYIYLTYISLLVCLSSLLYHFVKIVKLGNPNDLSTPSGNARKAMFYSFIGAMSPTKKESAYLHLPTYAAGLLYHMGTFLCIALLIAALVNLQFPQVVNWLLSAALVVSFASGVAILVKRMFSKELRQLSNPDDFISNILVTLFQLATAMSLLGGAPEAAFANATASAGLTAFAGLTAADFAGVTATASAITSAYFITASLLLLYMPVGKLKHAVYFFAARYHLAFFYGRRNVWPPKIK